MNHKSTKSDLMNDSANAMFSFCFLPLSSFCLTIVHLPFCYSITSPSATPSSYPADRGAPSHLCPGLHLLHKRHGGQPGHAEPPGAGGASERRRTLPADLTHRPVQGLWRYGQPVRLAYDHERNTTGKMQWDAVITLWWNFEIIRCLKWHWVWNRFEMPCNDSPAYF